MNSLILAIVLLLISFNVVATGIQVVDKDGPQSGRFEDGPFLLEQLDIAERRYSAGQIQRLPTSDSEFVSLAREHILNQKAPLTVIQLKDIERKLTAYLRSRVDSEFTGAWIRVNEDGVAFVKILLRQSNGTDWLRNRDMHPRYRTWVQPMFLVRE